MAWEEPAFVEINLDAEIGSYQSDFVEPQPPANAEAADAKKTAPAAGVESAP